jgi:5-formyltetrahydrofolate cyclo-ligase
MKSQQLKAAKRAIRREVLAARDALPPDVRAARAERIHERFLAVPEVVGAGTVLVFWSFGSEVPTAPLIARLHERGVRVLLPRIAGPELELVRYEPGDRLAGTSFGAMEPAGGDMVAPDEVDVVCTPGVAFDRSGRRVGYGGGFYDRLFASAPGVVRVGVAYAVQLAERDLPSGHADLGVDVLVTEQEVLRWPR